MNPTSLPWRRLLQKLLASDRSRHNPRAVTKESGRRIDRVHSFECHEILEEFQQHSAFGRPRKSLPAFPRYTLDPRVLHIGWLTCPRWGHSAPLVRQCQYVWLRHAE